MKTLAHTPAALLLAFLLPATVSETVSEPRSGSLARELTGLMAKQQLSAVAARDPDAPDRFIAALVFPGVQLLVVSAQYAAPSLLQEQLDKLEYKEIYTSLQEAPIADTKVFFQDLGADGLHAKPEAAVDVMYERMVDRTVFDGNPASHKMTEAAYAQKFASADAVYSRLLTLLIEQINAHSSTG